MELRLYPAYLIKTLSKSSPCWALIQPAFTCSKLAKETLEQGVKYVQS